MSQVGWAAGLDACFLFTGLGRVSPDTYMSLAVVPILRATIKAYVRNNASTALAAATDEAGF